MRFLRNHHVIVLGLLLALPTSIVHADPRLVARIAEINRAVASGNTYLPKPIEADDLGTYFQQLNYQIRPMTAALASAKAGLHPSLQEEGQLYTKMAADLAALEALHTRVQLLLAPEADFAAVLTRHQHVQSALAELDKLDATIAASEVGTKGDAWAAPHIAAQRKLAAALRAADAAVAAKAVALAKERADDNAKQASKALSEETKNLADKLTKDGLAGTAISDEDSAKIEANLAKLDPGAAFYLHAQLAGVRVLQRWQRPDSEQELAKLLDGKLESHGRSTGKALTVSIAAEPDRCYLLLGLFASNADDSWFADFTWGLPQGDQVQEFHIKPFVGLAEGFCTLRKKEHLVAHAGLGFQGTKNGMRYVVLSFARDHLPAELTSRIVVERGDQCDPVYWEAIWTHPLPGTLAFAGREPVIMLDGGSAEVIRLNDPTGPMTAPTALASSPTGSVQFAPNELEWGEGCPVNLKKWLPARSATSLKIVACYDRVAKKYGTTWDQIERQRGAARDMGGIAPAVENHATALMKQQDRDSAACSAIDEAAHKTLAKLNERLVDLYLQTPPADPTGRADQFARAGRGR